MFALLASVRLWGIAEAHFLLNINIRTIHVEHLDDGLRVYLRLPMPYLVADRIGAEQADGTVVPAPYTFNRVEDGVLMHYLDLAAFKQDPIGLGELVAAGHHVTTDAGELLAEVEAVRVMPGSEQSPFATLAEAKGSFDGPIFPAGRETTYVGDLVVDTILRYRVGQTVYEYSIASSLDPGLDGQENTANLVLDHLPGDAPLIFRSRGLLNDPITVSRSPIAAAFTFVVEGVRHILEGTDHVLFVLCLTIGAFGFRNLLWRVTGFTVGHTVTLILGFLGFAPSGAWFVPSIETGIALSIVYAGVIALMKKQLSATLLVTVLIGLLHGLGFSFVLHEILQLNSPNLWQSLLSFNLGVELGQIAIVGAVYPIMFLIARSSERAGSLSRWAIAVPCIIVAVFWTVERLLLVAESV